MTNPSTPASACASELFLWATNNQKSVAHLECAHKNLLRKVKKGIFDSEKAVRLMEYVAETAAKEYVQELRLGMSWYSAFQPAVRKECARLLVQDFAKENDIA